MLIRNNSHDGKYIVQSAYDLMKEPILDNIHLRPRMPDK